MARYRFTELARYDLASIVEYIAEQGGRARARSVLERIRRAVELLATMPGSGHLREDLTPEPVLFWPVYSYLIVYRPETRPIEIVRIVSGWRDLRTLLTGGSEPAP